jgi:rhamnogalacturonyl hydrolase YesR
MFHDIHGFRHQWGYNLLMGLDFLMKIGDVVDVERGFIQIQNAFKLDVQVLPPNTILMLFIH